MALRRPETWRDHSRNAATTGDAARAVTTMKTILAGTGTAAGVAAAVMSIVIGGRDDAEVRPGVAEIAHWMRMRMKMTMPVATAARW